MNDDLDRLAELLPGLAAEVCAFFALKNGRQCFVFYVAYLTPLLCRMEEAIQDFLYSRNPWCSL